MRHPTYHYQSFNYKFDLVIVWQNTMLPKDIGLFEAFPKVKCNAVFDVP